MLLKTKSFVNHRCGLRFEAQCHTSQCMQMILIGNDYRPWRVTARGLAILQAAESAAEAGFGRKAPPET